MYIVYSFLKKIFAIDSFNTFLVLAGQQLLDHYSRRIYQSCNETNKQTNDNIINNEVKRNVNDLIANDQMNALGVSVFNLLFVLFDRDVETYIFFKYAATTNGVFMLSKWALWALTAKVKIKIILSKKKINKIHTIFPFLLQHTGH